MKKTNLSTAAASAESQIKNFKSCGNWMSIPEFPNYLISRDGVLLSLKQTKNGVRVVEMTTDKIHQNGYCMVCLTYRQRRRVVQMGRLMLEVFCPRPDMDTLDADHIDGDRQNNALSNLRWLSHRQNVSIRRQRTQLHRNKPIVVFYTDGRISVFSSRKYCAIPLTTMSHLLHVTTDNKQFYTGRSLKYGVDRAFFLEDLPLNENFKKRFTDTDKQNVRYFGDFSKSNFDFEKIK